MARKYIKGGISMIQQKYLAVSANGIVLYGNRLVSGFYEVIGVRSPITGKVFFHFFQFLDGASDEPIESWQSDIDLGESELIEPPSGIPADMAKEIAKCGRHWLRDFLSH